MKQDTLFITCFVGGYGLLFATIDPAAIPDAVCGLLATLPIILFLSIGYFLESEK